MQRPRSVNTSAREVEGSEHGDEQVFRFAVVRIVIGAHMGVRALNGSLRARDSEQRG